MKKIKPCWRRRRRRGRRTASEARGNTGARHRRRKPRASWRQNIIEGEAKMENLAQASLTPLRQSVKSLRQRHCKRGTECGGMAACQAKWRRNGKTVAASRRRTAILGEKVKTSAPGVAGSVAKNRK